MRPVPVPDTVLDCGCRVTWHKGVAHFYPCSAVHETVAAYIRQPGSQLIVHNIKRSK